jgi:hypothetical protein
VAVVMALERDFALWKKSLQLKGRPDIFLRPKKFLDPEVSLPLVGRNELQTTDAV